MKLVFNQKDNGCALAYVECTSLEEADQFMSWYASRTGETPTTQTVEVPNNEPTAEQPKITRNDVSQAAIALVQTKGRDVLQPILATYGAKRISDIPDESLSEAFAKIKEAS